MLTFGRANTLLFAGLLTLNLLQFLVSLSGWWYLLPVSVYLLLIGLGSFKVDSQFHFPVICSNPAAGQGVVLSYDDGPDPVNTPRLLEVLKQHDIKAVFFLIGRKAAANPELVQRINAEGHILGNHTYQHSNFFDFLPAYGMARELLRSVQQLRSITGRDVRWFRPPFGVTNPMMKRALRKTRMIPIGWSIRSLDTTGRSTQQVLNRVQKAQAGDIILLHDTRPDAPELLEQTIALLHQKGLAILAPEQLIPEAPYSSTDTPAS